MRFVLRVSPLLLALVAFLAIPTATVRAQSGSFGVSVVLGDDEIVVAEPNTTFRPGTVYVFRRSGGGWEEGQRLRAPDAERADGFGTVLVATEGTLFVGQRGGAIHIFRRDGDAWRHDGTLEGSEGLGIDPGCDHYGYCGTDFGLALAADGPWLLVGESAVKDDEEGQEPDRPGSVRVFHRGDGGTWTLQARLFAPDSMPGDGFGAAVAIQQDRALVGAPGWGADGAGRAGRVYELVLEDGAWRITGPLESPAEPNAAFGSALALDEDVAMIGAPGHGGGHGGAFLYHRDPDGGTWSEHSRMAPFQSVRGDLFGQAVGLAGHDVWVGAPAPRGIATGSAYVFSGDDTSRIDSTRRIQLEETVTRDAFGDRIVARTNIVAVTASGMNHRSGAVYVYERDGADGWRRTADLVGTPDALEPLVGEERACEDGRIGPFDCEDVELLAFLPGAMLTASEHGRGVRMNDNWGWTDSETGREYALVGRNDGTSFVDVTDPVNPVVVGDLPKTPNTPPSQLWRDIKTYENHAFIVADGAGNHGMQIFDLTRLRDVTDPPVRFEPDLVYDNVASVHNVVINEETGFAYLVGARGGGETCGGGLHMVDIRDPQNPEFTGCFVDQRGTHDAQCLVYRGPDDRYRDREICLMSNAEAFVIADVADKENPRLVARVSHPDPAYMHQGWTTEDHRYHFMDDESDVIQEIVPTTRTLIWDLSDLEDPVLAEEFMGSMRASAHNLYIVGDRMYQANYRYGLHVLDISDPLSPEEIGHFDTSPYLSGPGFSGAWSNYPFFESGTIIVTSLQEGMFVLRKREVPEPVF